MEKKNAIRISVPVFDEFAEIAGGNFAKAVSSQDAVHGTNIKMMKHRCTDDVVVTVNGVEIGTMFVMPSTVDGKYEIAFSDAFHRLHILAKEDNGVLSTTNISLATAIQKIFSSFVNEFYVEDAMKQKIDTIVNAVGNMGDNIHVEEGCIEICDGEDEDGNPEGEWHCIKVICKDGLEMDNGDFYLYCELSDEDLTAILEYLTN